MSTLSTKVKESLERYFDAASNLYGIISLSKLLKIYNMQNAPVSEKDFLEFVEELDQKHKHFYIIGEDEMYDDVDTTSPIDRDLVAEYIIIDDDDPQYYKVKENQFGKPYYVPDKEKFLRYEDEFYIEKTLSFISLRAFFRNQPNLTKDQADEIASNVHGCANAYEGRLEPVIDLIDYLGFQFDEKTIEEFMPLYSEMYNDTRLHFNCGYTPNELSQIKQMQPF